MKILLVYFTGTYNTRYLTDRLIAALVARGNSVEKVEINCRTPAIDAREYDLIGFGYPIYGFNSPLPFNRFLKKIHLSKGQKYFIYKNSGETYAINNASSRILIRRMKRRKLQFAGEYHYVMPYNIHFPFDRNFIREILLHDRKLTEIMLYNLEHGIAPKLKSRFLYNLAAAVVGIQKLGGNLNSFLYRVDRTKCVKCMKCVTSCPERNICFVNGTVRFGHRCDMCMRCSFDCPTQAIRIGILEGWKVARYYDLNEIARDPSPIPPYITENSKGFYKCFIRYFAKIDSDYAKLFPESDLTK